MIYFVFHLKRYAKDLARIVKAGWVPLSIAANPKGGVDVLASHGDPAPFHLMACWADHLSTHSPDLETFYDPEVRCRICGKPAMVRA